jgi:peroxiredoxin
MQAYQLGIASLKIDPAETQVFGISTDNSPSQRRFSDDLKLNFPLLSDFVRRDVAKAYGILMPDRGIANRATFIVDTEGKIQYIEEGSSAIDISGAATACSRLKKK